MLLGGSRGERGGQGSLLAADIAEAKEEGSRVDVEDKDSCCRPHKVPHLTNLSVHHNNRTPLFIPEGAHIQSVNKHAMLKPKRDR